MDAPKGNGLDAANDQPAKTYENSSNDSTTGSPWCAVFPMRKDTVAAEVLCRLVSGEVLTGMDAVFCASTTRLAAVVEYLEKKYFWDIDRGETEVGTNDGRVVGITTYYLNPVNVRQAFDSGAQEFCSGVREERAKRRCGASLAVAVADKRNASRIGLTVNLRSDSMFGAAYDD